MRNFVLDHSPIDVVFNKNSDNFVVKEIPLYEFSGDGEHTIVHVEKKDLSTPELLEILSSTLGVKIRDFGYAGLKDKLGLTRQFISFHKNYEDNLKNLNHPKIKIIDVFRHKNKLKIGHLKGNHFFVKFKKVNNANATKLQNVIEILKKTGFGNYFGYQRFGNFGDNAKLGEEILDNKKSFKNKKLNKFLINALQSELFNNYLSKRLEISKLSNSFNKKEFKEIYKFDDKLIDDLYRQKTLFKLIDGEVFNHYPFGKNFLEDNFNSAIKRFEMKEISPTGLLIGSKVMQSIGSAKILEDEIFSDFYEKFINVSGSRRMMWVFADDLEYKYNQLNAQFSISFSLIKGAYATTFIEELLHCERL